MVSENFAQRGGGVAVAQRALGVVCCVLATVGVLVERAQGGFFPDGRAETISDVGSGGVQPGGPGLAPPDAAATLRVYEMVSAYVRGSGSLDALREGGPGTVPVHGCTVVLRLGGEVLGRGSSIGMPGSAPGAARVAEAVAGAWLEVEKRIPAVAPGASPEVQAARAERVKRTREEVLISLELSGPMIRIGAGGYADLDVTLEPGMDGLAAVMEGKINATFPSAALMGNVMPGDAARRSVAGVARMVREDGASTVSLTEPADLEKKHGVTLFRFRTSHVAQWRFDRAPELLYRGQKLILQQDVDEVAELWHIADRLAGNLANRLTVKPPVGRVSLGAGTSEEPDAQSCALARHALLEYYMRWPTPQRWESIGEKNVRAVLDRTREAAVEYLRLARAGVAAQDDRARLATNALIARNPDSKSPPEERVLEAEFVDQKLKSSVPPGVRGLVMWGRGNWPGSRTREADSYHPMEPAVRALMAETPVGGLAGEMPWLGWIDLSIDDHLKRARGSKSAPALREMRTLIWKHQVRGVDAGPDRQDMVGGIVVPALPGAPTVPPTWQTARLVAFLGTMLGEPELTTKAERGGEIVKLLGAARFLRQLQVDDTMEWLCKDATLVKGGARNATWDQRTQTDATAMTLLAVLEIISGVERVSNQGK